MVQNPQRTGIHKTVFTAVGFNKRADAVATVDNRGNVLAFRIRSNRYALLAREGHAGTAVAMGNGEVFVAFADNVVRGYDGESG